ncbi:MAG: MFS transporter [Reyranella sp.]|uniref:MFS transporter n=1 Tax=Reyranella sp. TaxID=1929291 RepID=UPI003D0FFD26
MGEPHAELKAALVPVGAMLGTQIAISLAVLALSVLMPAVARDLAVDPKLVGGFTAITYAVAAAIALGSAGAIARLGAVRVCQLAMIAAAAGLAVTAAASLVATVVAVVLIGLAQGPINPASAHILSQRVPRRWFSLVFSVKQTGVPVGFATAGIVLPLLLGWVGWRGASLAAGAMLLAGAFGLGLLRRRLDAAMTPPGPSPGIWRSFRFVIGHPALRVLGLSALIYVVAQHTFTFFLVTYLYEHCRLDIAQAGFLLFLAQLAGTGQRLVLGALGDRLPRMMLLGWTGLAIAAGAAATALIATDTPYWLIAAIVVAYGTVVISWNGVSIAEFAHLAPPGQVAAVAAVQTALAFSGAVIGPPLFAVIAALASYRAAFLAVAVIVLIAALWQVAVGRTVLKLP